MLNSSKPYSPSCDENKHAILAVIRPLLTSAKTILEIGSGTGQHAVFFAEQMPHLIWQPSDLAENYNGIQQWVSEANLPNVLETLPLDVSQKDWPNQTYDAVFSANSFHIMGKHHVEDFFTQINRVLNNGAILMIYGPFNYNGNYTSDSNERFDMWLKQRNAQSGIKDFEWCNELAEQAGLSLQNDFEMPQNNRVLVWKNSLF